MSRKQRMSDGTGGGEECVNQMACEVLREEGQQRPVCSKRRNGVNIREDVRMGYGSVCPLGGHRKEHA